MARFGSFRPWPVTVHTMVSSRDDHSVARRLQQAGHRRGRGGLDEHAFGRREQLVRVEDLVVGDGLDGTA